MITHLLHISRWYLYNIVYSLSLTSCRWVVFSRHSDLPHYYNYFPWYGWNIVIASTVNLRNFSINSECYPRIIFVPFFIRIVSLVLLFQVSCYVFPDTDDCWRRRGRESMELQLPVQSVPITSEVVSSNPDQNWYFVEREVELTQTLNN